jgi:hypothetical protein
MNNYFCCNLPLSHPIKIIHKMKNNFTICSSINKINNDFDMILLYKLFLEIKTIKLVTIKLFFIVKKFKVKTITIKFLFIIKIIENEIILIYYMCKIESLINQISK